MSACIPLAMDPSNELQWADVPHIVGVRDCRELLGGVWWYAFACVKIKTTADRMRDEAEEEEAAAVERANRVIFYTPEDTKHSDDDEDDEDTREEEFKFLVSSSRLLLQRDVWHHVLQFLRLESIMLAHSVPTLEVQMRLAGLPFHEDLWFPEADLGTHTALLEWVHATYHHDRTTRHRTPSAVVGPSLYVLENHPCAPERGFTPRHVPPPVRLPTLSADHDRGLRVLQLETVRFPSTTPRSLRCDSVTTTPGTEERSSLSTAVGSRQAHAMPGARATPDVVEVSDHDGPRRPVLPRCPSCQDDRGVFCVINCLQCHKPHCICVCSPVSWA